MGIRLSSILAFAAISIVVISPFMITSAEGELLVDRSSIKLDADKDKNLEFSILVRAKEGETKVSSSANDLVEENGYGVIPSSTIKAKLANENINSTDYTVLTYSVNVPADQRSGLYKGKIILVEENGTLTEIPIELSVRTENDYVAAFWLILLGTFTGAAWEGINKYRGESAKTNADKEENEKTATAIKKVVGTNLGTDQTNFAELEALNEKFRAENLHALKLANVNQLDQIENDRTTAEINRELIETGKEAEKKVKEADARKPELSTLLQVLAISLAAVLATTFVFNQFLQSNPFFSPERIQGQILAFGFGFAAYLSFENLLTQAKKTIKPAST